ncbi:lipopolysaccharide kinase InaA family protein [uncultured Salinisphaera sp.]|uniref:lipopolysaccharide kinase InaA family protein n=1 Tax=uncultured Salinisphaera sp. TaxID=359372 RepID=UPI0032B1837C
MGMTVCRGLVTRHDLWWVDAPIAARRPDFAQAQTLYEGTYTRISRHPGHPALISKLAWVKSAPRDHMRKFWAAQAKREIAANRIMQRLGMQTATLTGYGIPLAPWSRAESLLFMDELPAHDTLRVVLTHMVDENSRAGLLDRIACDIARLYRDGWHHKDCHLENVLLPRTAAGDGASPALIWVDNDLRHSACGPVVRRRFDASLRQLAYTSRNFISSAEWQVFAQRLARYLSSTELGRELAATSVVEFARARLPS